MMEQVEVCNSWEEFEDNSKLLEQQLEKLQLQKGRQNIPESKQEPELRAPEPIGLTEGVPKLRVLRRAPTKNPDATENGVAGTSTNEITTHSEIVIQDDSMRTQYVPPEPRISILSRPKKKSSEDSSGSKNSQSKSKSQAVKTLEQREQEYAEARRRIFGDAAETVETESSDTST